MTAPLVETAPRCVVDCADVVGESPVWHPEERVVYWCDVCGFALRRFDPRSGDVSTWSFDEPVVSIALTSDPERLLVALGSRIVLWRTQDASHVELARPEPDWPRHRLNDGGVAPDGTYLVGSMPNNVGPTGELVPASGTTGSLYRVGLDGTSERVDAGFAVPNTCVVSPDAATFYCGDSGANLIYAYTFDPNGGIGAKRVFTRGFGRGVPDGSAVDADGYVWNGRFSGGCLVRFAPDGTVDAVIELPVSNVTHCAFGGDDGRLLYATSARLLAPDNEPFAGGLFELRTRVRGVPPYRFKLAESRSLPHV